MGRGGCFTAHYPQVEWLTAPCETAPAPPEGPSPWPAPEDVGGNTLSPFSGNGNAQDYVAQVAGSMSSVTGSFTYVSPNTTETGLVNGQGPSKSDSYSIQLNSGLFSTPLCSSCKGWEQFVYNSNDNAVFIQNWVLSPTVLNACPTPSGWNPNTFGWVGPFAYGQGGSACYTSSNMGSLATSVPTPAQLTDVTMTGNIYPIPGTNCADDPNGFGNGNGYCDTVVMTASGNATAVSGDNPEVLGLEGNWSQAEFGIYGDDDDDTADFSTPSGSTAQINVQTSNNSSNNLKLTCLAQAGLTGESNNLYLPSTPQMSTSGTPAMTVDQSSTAPTLPPSCADAVSSGETHLLTFSNDPGATSDLLYNFQATGDYTLAQTSGFDLQSQQIPDPANNQLAVNQDVGAQIGGSDVAVCSNPSQLLVNGTAVNLANGGTYSLPQGEISLSGSTYVIKDDSGDFVETRLNQVPNGGGYWLDASVGIGTWPTAVSGLLANAGNNVNEVESSIGTVLSAPFAFKKFYGDYATSWRVPPGESLMSACGAQIKFHNPTKNFTANDLKPSLYDAALSDCTAAGVATSLIDDCILDVATLGGTKKTINADAANVYANFPTNITWGAITTGRGPTPPGAPTGVTATPGHASATVSFEPPTSNGGNPITGYAVTATDTTNPTDGGQTASGTSSPIALDGLTDGDAYTFTVTATNQVGTSSFSSPSNSVTIPEPQPNVFIADSNNDRVVEVPADGGPQTTVGTGLYYPEGVAVDAAGDVFIADTLNHRVVEVPAGGGSQVTTATGLDQPSGVAVDAAGDLFIAVQDANDVVEVPAGGGAQRFIGTGLYDPCAVAVDAAGDVFIADTGNNRVVEVPADGGSQTTVGTGLKAPSGVAVDAAGDVFIGDTGNNRVVEVPADGGSQTTVGTGLKAPSGVAVDAAGDVFIGDTGNNRVVEVPADGGSQTTVGTGLSFPAGVAVQ